MECREIWESIHGQGDDSSDGGNSPSGAGGGRDGKDDEHDKFFAADVDEDEGARPEKEAKLFLLVDNYLTSKRRNGVEELLKIPELKKMYIKYNTRVPSSAAAERLFSLCGRIFTPLRTRMAGPMLNKLAFLYGNMHVPLYARAARARCASARK